MPKPKKAITVTIPDVKGFNMANYGKNVAQYPERKKTEPGVNIYDKTIGAAFSKEQREVMTANGLDEFDLVFINGKSVRETFGFSKDAHDAYGLFTNEMMKAAVIGALADGDKKVEFCNVKKGKDNSMQITPPIGVEADIKFKHPKPKIGWGGKIRTFFGLPKLDKHKTVADRAKEVLNESDETRSKRHEAIAADIKARSLEAKHLLNSQEPYKKAIGDHEKNFERNMSLFNRDENNQELPLKEIKKYEEALGLDFRSNIHYGQKCLFMLHKGMTMEEICSDSPQFDEKKIEYGKEYNKMIKDAGNVALKAGEDAQENKRKELQVEYDKEIKEAREKAGQEFDEKFNNNRDAHDWGLRLLDSADPEKEIDYRADINKLIKEERDKQIEAAANKVKAEFDKKMEKLPQILKEANEKGILKTREEIHKNPEGKIITEAFFGMGKQLHNLETNPKGFDLKETLGDYGKFQTMIHMTQSYRHEMKLFIPGLTEEQKESFQRYKDAEELIGVCVTPSVNTVKYIATDGFVWPEKTHLNDLAQYKIAEKLSPIMNDIMMKSPTFGEACVPFADKVGKDNSGIKVTGVTAWNYEIAGEQVVAHMDLFNNADKITKKELNDMNKGLAKIINPPKPADDIAKDKDIKIIKSNSISNKLSNENNLRKSIGKFN
ncbi:MAG: hypothetical protein LBC86_09720 [Oscillospiraceae bacterium]|jgi:hypothetical protein|nr:hypothetical protein [Oscillospiraceae bacterium]